MSRVFVAGATGVVGRRLVPLLLDDGWRVFGVTRSPQRAQALAAIGVEPLVIDVYDTAALARAIAKTRPAVVVHQLTDLPPGLDPARMAGAVERNARIRREGTANLVTAALGAGVPRLVAQSIAWAYAPATAAHREDDALDLQATGARAITVRGVAELECRVLRSPPLEGVVLRYGHLYGPGTGTDSAKGLSIALHVDAAAWAARLAMYHGEPGIYNVAEPDGYLDTRKAEIQLGWRAGWRLTELQG